MGGAKGELEKLDVPDEGWCGDRVCIDVDFCASRTVRPIHPGKPPKFQPFKKLALVTTHDLHRAVGFRFHNFKEMKVRFCFRGGGFFLGSEGGRCKM